MAIHNVEVAIIGAGIGGLATAHHAGYDSSLLIESKPYYSGHVHSEVVEGFTWDDGPHVSFTVNKYVEELLAMFVDDQYEKMVPTVSNYYQGHWIPHPAQINLSAVPEPLRTRCLESFLATRDDNREPANYQEWIDIAFGPVFAATFPAAYTRKYWTVEPAQLATEWIGNRVLKPSVEDVLKGMEPVAGWTGPHYMADKRNRYPTTGGFMGYTHYMGSRARMLLGTSVESVDLPQRRLMLSNGDVVEYKNLVNTMPLKAFIHACINATPELRMQADLLTCTHFLRIDLAVDHPARRPESWFYVYDEDKYSTRVSVMEKFAASNAPANTTAIQVEVYGSEYRALPHDDTAVVKTVIDEMVEMGMIDSPAALRYANHKRVPQGNPIFDHNRKAVIDAIHGFLEPFGVELVGRYGEHRYLMTDACIISGRRAASRVTGKDLGDDPEVFLSKGG